MLDRTQHGTSAYAKLNLFLDSLRRQHLRLAYADVRVDSEYSDIAPSEAELGTLFSKHVPLRIPIVSAAMDTVTEAEMAIAMAVHGGIGTIHKNLTPKEQSKMVARVKHHQNGKLIDAISVTPDMSVQALEDLRAEKSYLFHRFPVLDGEKRLLGLVTRKDLEFCDDHSLSVSKIMTQVAGLTIVSAETTKKEAYAIMKDCKRESLPFVSEDGTFGGLFLFKDLRKIFNGDSTANVDANDQLRVAAAVGVGELELERAELLLRAKCDVLVVDTAHGNSKRVLDTIAELKLAFPGAEIVAGNVSNARGALALAKAGVDGIRIGQGPGSICTTRIVAGIGAPQASAVLECAAVLREEGFRIPVCADGGIEQSGDIVVALVLGASSVTCGNLLAGTDEAPGEVILDETTGFRAKKYRGMGSLAAMRENQGSRDRYNQADVPNKKLVAEGVEASVPCRGQVSLILDRLCGGVRQGMGYLGVRTIEDLPKWCEPFRIEAGGVRESGPHGVNVLSSN